ncbi:alpha/beta fold hydrolase [Methylobacterium tarhaniae]|uniref:alpha/beta fold hydrolase n=1 Tax=Methylobacterium tarhaniae TaxID=1187852 RepID=UPI003CFFF224
MPELITPELITPEPKTGDGIDATRRAWMTGAGALLAAASFAGTGPARAQPAAPAGAPPGFGPLKRIEAGDLSVAFAEAGPRDGKPVLLLHGWPYDIHSYAEVAPILAASGHRVLIPYLRGYGETRFRSQATPRNGQQAALAADALAFLDALAVERALVAGYDWGARTACILAALSPERCTGLVSVSGYLIGSQQANAMPLPPKAELQWWYQFYFATERGREGYARYTRDFARLIWEIASPRWRFDDATFARSAAALENPDHVAVSIHNYRWRLGLAEGEARFDATERKLAAFPTIAVPTITLEGDANGAPHPQPSAYAKMFTGPYAHRTLTGGIGHNLPQEAPRTFAQAVVDVDAL